MKNLIAEFMQSLTEFEAYVVQNEFTEMFGEDRGLELWNLFRNKCAGSTTIFYRMLNNDDRQVFNHYLATSRWFKESQRLSPI